MNDEQRRRAVSIGLPLSTRRSDAAFVIASGVEQRTRGGAAGDCFHRSAEAGVGDRIRDEGGASAPASGRVLRHGKSSRCLLDSS